MSKKPNKKKSVATQSGYKVYYFTGKVKDGVGVIETAFMHRAITDTSRTVILSRFRRMHPKTLPVAILNCTMQEYINDTADRKAFCRANKPAYTEMTLESYEELGAIPNFYEEYPDVFRETFNIPETEQVKEYIDKNVDKKAYRIREVTIGDKESEKGYSVTYTITKSSDEAVFINAPFSYLAFDKAFLNGFLSTMVVRPDYKSNCLDVNAQADGVFLAVSGQVMFKLDYEKYWTDPDAPMPVVERSEFD
jgi:hypothetical protein